MLVLSSRMKSVSSCSTKGGVKGEAFKSTVATWGVFDEVLKSAEASEGGDE